MADDFRGADILGPDAAQHLRDAQILRESIQEFPGPVAVYDDLDRLIACNELYRWVQGAAFQRVVEKTGSQRFFYEDLVRESAKDAVPSEKLEAYVADRLRAQRDADGKPTDRYYPDRGWFRIFKVRTPSGAVVGFATDITELKEKTVALEEARAAAEAASIAKSAFLANMSHELRTPLNAIIGLSEALELGVFGSMEDRHRDYIRDIHTSGNHLLALISDLLDLAKVEAGKMELEPEEVDLNGLIGECLTMMSPIASQNRITIENSLPGRELLVRADRRKLKQALLNILSNAVKYSNPGGSVFLSLLRTTERLAIKVRDEGIGIDMEQLDYVFEPFGRLQSSFTAMPDGAGLGLPIARRLMELHGGDITIESNPGKGTAVTLILPATVLV